MKHVVEAPFELLFNVWFYNNELLHLQIRYYHKRPRKAPMAQKKEIYFAFGHCYTLKRCGIHLWCVFHIALVSALHCGLTLEFISNYMILWLWYMFLQAKGNWALIPHQEEHTMCLSLCLMICFWCITFKCAMWKYECYDVLYLCLLNGMLYMSNFYIL